MTVGHDTIPQIINQALKLKFDKDALTYRECSRLTSFLSLVPSAGYISRTHSTSATRYLHE